MNDNRHPAGTSIGGQWAPGSSGEVDDALDDDGYTPGQGIAESLLDESFDKPALDIISGARHDANGEDLSLAKHQLHSYVDNSRPGPNRSEANIALNKLYAAEYLNRSVGIGRLVGNNEACRAAERELSVQQDTSRAQNMLAASTSRLRGNYPDMAGVVIDAEDSDDVRVTGEYVGADGEVSGYLDSDDMMRINRAYAADAHRKLTPSRSTADLYAHRSGQTYVLDVDRSSEGYSSIAGFHEKDAGAIDNQRVAEGAFAIRHDRGDQRTVLFVDRDSPHFVNEERMGPR